MSRWAETFAALSGASDTLDTMRHSEASPSIVSHCVNSVTAAPTASKPAMPSAADRALAIWGEAEEERAAIVEHYSAIPRAWAEGFAQLDPDRPPGDVLLMRWRRFVDDVGLFLGGPFCAVAAALGWGPHDLFGCDRDRPFARIDQAGLLWLLNGNKLIALSATTATIETCTGERHIWRRKLAEPGRVLAWKLEIGSAIKIAAVTTLSAEAGLRGCPQQPAPVGAVDLIP